MAVAKRLYKALKVLVVMVLAVTAVVYMGTHVSTVESTKIESAGNTLVTIGLAFAVLRVAFFGSVFTWGWGYFTKYVVSQSGLELQAYRWRLASWYVAMEAVVLIQLYGTT